MEGFLLLKYLLVIVIHSWQFQRIELHRFREEQKQWITNLQAEAQSFFAISVWFAGIYKTSTQR
jgi:hypothetical protein